MAAGSFRVGRAAQTSCQRPVGPVSPFPRRPTTQGLRGPRHPPLHRQPDDGAPAVGVKPQLPFTGVVDLAGRLPFARHVSSVELIVHDGAEWQERRRSFSGD
ncbi:hypothetical protein EAO71_02735 [Streptomyces sp. ms191]|nr:hypothetical protein EAO71_02735 [Streptomyces sp. ms191]